MVLLPSIALSMMLATATLAQAPVASTSYDFSDPVFNQTVVCQTEAEIKAIVAAAVPNTQFRDYRDQGQCLTMPEFTAAVSTVNFLGPMVYDDQDSFSAWSVEVSLGNATAWALYLEAVKSASS